MNTNVWKVLLMKGYSVVHVLSLNLAEKPQENIKKSKAAILAARKWESGTLEGAGVGAGGVSPPAGRSQGPPPGKFVLHRCSESLSPPISTSNMSSLHEMSCRFWWQSEVGFMRFLSQQENQNQVYSYAALPNLPESTCSFMK